MKAWFIARDRFLLGPVGWTPDIIGAMRFLTKDDAERGMKDQPMTLVTGASVIEREWQPDPTAPNRIMAVSEYDPYGHNR